MSSPQLTVYYDHSCRFCRGEVTAIRSVAPAGAIDFVDCSAPGFVGPDAAQRAAISQRDMMTLLHVLDAEGRWHVGVDAFVRLYNVGGLPAIADVWANPVVGAVMRRVYPWMARNRNRLGLLGILSTYLVGRAARKALADSRRCGSGSCRVS